MPSSRSSSPAPRPSSPETTRGARSTSPSGSGSSPRPSRLLQSFQRRVTSTFRRNSRASISDVTDLLGAGSSSSRPTTPDIPETTSDSAPAPTKEGESDIKKEEPTATLVAEPVEMHEEPAAMEEDAPVEKSEPVAEVQPAAEPAAEVHVEQPEHVEEPVLVEVPATSDEESETHKNAVTAPVEPEEHEHEAHEIETPVSAVAVETATEEFDPFVGEHHEHEHDEASTTESPAPSMPVPELHHRESSESSFPAAKVASVPHLDAEDPFSTPSTRATTLGDHVHVVHFNEPSYQDRDNESQVTRPQEDLLLSSANFDRNAFDRMVDDFAEKAAARLLADDGSIINSSREMPTARLNTGYDGQSEVNFRPNANGILSDAPSTSAEQRRAESDALMHDTLRRLSQVPVQQTATLLIPQWNEHRLPDGSMYWSRPISYDLPMLLLVTDIDLREPGALGRVESFLARSSMTSDDELDGAAEMGQERDIWLAFSGPMTRTHTMSTPITPTDPSAFRIIMVDHSKRTTLPHIDGKNKDSEDEVSFRLDMEHSYWSFVESHPAHRETSERDRDEAMEFLAWCFADQLVQDEQGGRYPFTLAQCRELMELMRTVDDSTSGARGAMIKARVVAKISLRNVAWRQALYASSKNISTDTVIVAQPSAPSTSNNTATSPTAVSKPTTPKVNPGAVQGGLRMMASLVYNTAKVFFAIPMAGVKLAASVGRMTANVASALVWGAPPSPPKNSRSPRTPRPAVDEELATLLQDPVEPDSPIRHRRVPQLDVTPPTPLTSQPSQQAASEPNASTSRRRSRPASVSSRSSSSSRRPPSPPSLTVKALAGLSIIPITFCLTSIAGGVLAITVVDSVIESIANGGFSEKRVLALT